MRAFALAAALVAGSAPPVVPWLDTPAPRASAHPPLAAPCRAADLRAQLVLQGATGSLVGGVELTNVGPAACALVGRPRVAFAGATSRYRVVPIPRQRVPDDVLADPVGSLRALARGKAAGVTLWWSNWCGAGHVETGNPGRPPTALDLALPGGSTVVVPTPDAPRCDQPSTPSRLAVGPFSPALRRLGPDSRLPLAASILGARPVHVKPGVAAFRVRRGETLAFVVALRNTGKTPFRFAGACPVYVEEVVPAPEHAYVLNCAPVGAIPSGATVRFAMRVAIPADARIGVTGLSWQLAPATYLAPFATATLEVGP